MCVVCAGCPELTSDSNEAKAQRAGKVDDDHGDLAVFDEGDGQDGGAVAPAGGEADAGVLLGSGDAGLDDGSDVVDAGGPDVEPAAWWDGVWSVTRTAHWTAGLPQGTAPCEITEANGPSHQTWRLRSDEMVAERGDDLAVLPVQEYPAGSDFLVVGVLSSPDDVWKLQFDRESLTVEGTGEWWNEPDQCWAKYVVEGRWLGDAP